MVKFAHIADCHLGSWRQPQLQELNLLSFKRVIDQCIKEMPDFILIAGDLFDSAYPPIEILKESFAVFKKIKDAGIPVYLIAGSHDFSASGKTFLDVLEKAGFCQNIEKATHEESGKIRLKPTFHKEIAIYGYSGRKSGMEIEDLKKVYLESVHPLTIFAIHTTIRDVVGNVPMEYIEKEKLPIADYYAMGHIHKRFETEYASAKFVYPGPTFPCNFQELSDLGCGSYQMVEIEGGKIKTRSIEVPIKDTCLIEIEVENALTATEMIISKIDRLNLRDKIVLLRLYGNLKSGKSGDIKFSEIESFLQKKGAYAILRNISRLKSVSVEEFSVKKGEGAKEIEERIIKEYSAVNPAEFNKYLPTLMNILATEKNEEEKNAAFEERIISEIKNTLEVGKLL
ncbi:exonuclease SbcCD subunit D [Candidatus Pacearchaeota archaeon]|nr:MAG: exonuclease SbcCD subunit D [Candidatus Pacearchaeota archaeon]